MTITLSPDGVTTHIKQTIYLSNLKILLILYKILLNMANVVMIVLSLTIGIFFVLVGIMKLSPVFSDDIYREMRKSYIRSVKVLCNNYYYNIILDHLADV